MFVPRESVVKTYVIILFLAFVVAIAATTSPFFYVKVVIRIIGLDTREFTATGDIWAKLDSVPDCGDAIRVLRGLQTCASLMNMWIVGGFIAAKCVSQAARAKVLAAFAGAASGCSLIAFVLSFVVTPKIETCLVNLAKDSTYFVAVESVTVKLLIAAFLLPGTTLLAFIAAIVAAPGGGEQPPAVDYATGSMSVVMMTPAQQYEQPAVGMMAEPQQYQQQTCAVVMAAPQQNYQQYEQPTAVVMAAPQQYHYQQYAPVVGVPRTADGNL